MAGPRTHLVHATAIAAGGRAVLIRGPSGSGKSDLALRCLALGETPFSPAATLVSDDQVVLSRIGEGQQGGGFLLSAPPTIRGIIEVRGVGIVEVPAVDSPVPLALVADLVPAPARIERLPDAPETNVFGLRYPLVEVSPFEPSAPVKLLIALALHGLRGAVQQLGSETGVDET